MEIFDTAGASVSSCYLSSYLEGKVGNPRYVKYERGLVNHPVLITSVHTCQAHSNPLI